MNGLGREVLLPAEQLSCLLSCLAFVCGCFAFLACFLCVWPRGYQATLFCGYVVAFVVVALILHRDTSV